MDSIRSGVDWQFPLASLIEVGKICSVPILRRHKRCVDLKSQFVVEGMGVAKGSFIHGLDILRFSGTSTDMVNPLFVICAEALVFKRAFTLDQEDTIKSVGAIEC